MVMHNSLLLKWQKNGGIFFLLFAPRPECKLTIHELRGETYNGLVRLLKPGCRTVVLLVDQESKPKLLPQFFRAVFPYRKWVLPAYPLSLKNKEKNRNTAYIEWHGAHPCKRATICWCSLCTELADCMCRCCAFCSNGMCHYVCTKLPSGQLTLCFFAQVVSRTRGRWGSWRSSWAFMPMLKQWSSVFSTIPRSWVLQY